MFSIFYFIVILFMCLVLPLNFMIGPIVGAINTGGSIFYIFGLLTIFAGAVVMVVVVYKRIKNQPPEQDEPSEDTKRLYQMIDDVKKAQIASSMGGEGAKVTMEVTEEIVTKKSDLTDFEKEAIQNVKNLGESGDIDWTISTVETNGERNKEYNAAPTSKDKTIVGVKKANKITQTIFKVLGIVVLVAIEVLLVIGAVRRVTVFGTININDAHFKSISNIAGYYISCDSSHTSQSLYGEELTISYSFTYSTNKKTEEVYQKYKDYLDDECWYNSYQNFYYLTDPDNSEYMYSVTISSSENSVTITYEYEEKPYWLI